MKGHPMKKTNISIPPLTDAWLRWQAAIEDITRDQLIQKALADYHAKASKKNPNTPAIESPEA